MNIEPKSAEGLSELRFINLGVSIMSIVAAIFWFILRTGFGDYNTLQIFTALGVGLFIIHFKNVFERWFNLSYKPQWCNSESFVLIIALAVIALLGYLPSTVCKVLSAILALAGVFAFYNSVAALVSENIFRKRIIVCVYLALGFGTFMVSIVWSGYLNPLFLEMLAMLDPEGNNIHYLGDTLYHMTVAQMLKYNHLPSGAVDGTPFLYYHFGSHWLFAQFSSFFDIPVRLAFNICYPLIFVPLFIKAVLVLALDIQFLQRKKPVITWVGIFVLFFIFFRIPDHRYAGGYNSVHMLLSESQLISLLFLMAVVSTSLIFVDNLRSGMLSKEQHWFFMVIVLPILFFTVGMMKISSLFVLCLVAGYVFVRLRLWSLPIVTGMFVSALACLFTYWLTSETVPYLRESSAEGGFNFMAFYKGDVLHDANVYFPFDWFFMFLLWAYAFVILHFASRKMHRENTLAWEILLVTIIAGLLPSFFLQFFGANTVYFAAIQLYVSCVLLIAYGATFQEFLLKAIEGKLKRVIVIVVCLGCALIAHRRIGSSIKNIFRLNNEIRTYYFQTVGTKEKQNRFDLFTYDYSKNLASHRMHQYLMSCCALDKSPQKYRGEALVYVDSRQLKGMGSCIEKTFLVPALTGFPRIEGMPYDCHLHNYGDHQFEWNYESSNPDPPFFTKQEICQKVNAKGFQSVFIFNVASNTFEYTDCK